jgi:ABC-type proline/glycine betaine transport system substrate-binding protein
MKIFAAALGLTTVLASTAAFAADAESCKTGALSDVGWTDIQATTGVQPPSSSTALGYEPQVIDPVGAGHLCLAEEQGHRRLPRQLDAEHDQPTSSLF